MGLKTNSKRQYLDQLSGGDVQCLQIMHANFKGVLKNLLHCEKFMNNIFQFHHNGEKPTF